ncbi:MAG: DUF3597 domain-containing protein [Gammaproteobacteria bacterium]|nr:MAG: DUF3597 domain-containing protein [Gammaproteobacteria bacterium]
MSILKNIFDKIFHSAHAKTQPDQPSSATNSGPLTSPAANAPAQSITPISETNVEKVLAELAAKAGQPLNWRTSIVDLLKLLDLDSSLESRKELAKELDYSGDTNDSSTMNIWLHKQVMNKLAANGGKVPADLKD